MLDLEIIDIGRSSECARPRAEAQIAAHTRKANPFSTIAFKQEQYLDRHNVPVTLAGGPLIQAITKAGK